MRRLSRPLWTEGEGPIRHPLTHPDLLLLKAALPDPGGAVSAWREFKAGYDIEAVSETSAALLPFVFRNLSRSDLDERSDQSMGKLKGLYKRVWYKNQILVRDLAVTLQRLHAAAIETMLTDTCSLALRYYKDLGLRSIDNFHILVHNKDIAAARQMAELGGQKPNEKDAQGRHLIIYPYLMGNLSCQIDDSVWQDAEPFTVLDTPTAVLSATDQLLYSLLLYDSPYIAPPLWALDVLTVASQPHLDWQKLSGRIQQFQLTEAAAEALACLSRLTEIGLVPELLKQLQLQLVSAAPKAPEEAHAKRATWTRFQGICSRILNQLKSGPP